jgi:hypothetical protein
MPHGELRRTSFAMLEREEPIYSRSHPISPTYERYEMEPRSEMLTTTGEFGEEEEADKPWPVAAANLVDLAGEEAPHASRSGRVEELREGEMEDLDLAERVFP